MDQLSLKTLKLTASASLHVGWNSAGGLLTYMIDASSSVVVIHSRMKAMSLANHHDRQSKNV